MEKISIKDDEILELLSDNLDRARTFASDRSERRKSDYERYRAAPYPGDEQKKNRGWSTTVNSVISNAVNWTVPGLVEIFTGDFFEFKLPEVQQAEALRQYIRRLLYKQQDGERKIDTFITDSLVHRDGGLFKIYYKQDYELETERYKSLTAQEFEQLSADPAITISRYTEESYMEPLRDEWGMQVIDEFGEPAFVEVSEFKDVKAVRKVITYLGPAVDAVPPDEFFITPEAKSIDDARLCYHETKRTLHYIRKREKSGVYRKGVYAKVRDKLANNEGAPEVEQEREERIQLEGLTDLPNDFESDEKELRPATEVKVREIYTSMDIDNDGLLEPVIVWESCGIILQVEENPYKRPPFRRGVPFPLNHQWSQDPYPAQLEADQRLITNMDRLAQDSAALATYTNPITNDPQLYKSLLKRGPHTVLQGDPGRIGDASPKGGRNQFILKVKEDAVGAVENKSGITRYNQGLDANSLNKTLGGIDRIMSAAQQRQALVARRLGWTMKEVISDFLNILHMWPTREYMQIMQGQPVPVEAIEINVGVSPNEKFQKAQFMEQLIQWMSGPGAQMGVPPEKIMEALKRKYQLLDIKIDKYLPSPEEANGQRQLMQKMQQMGEQMEKLKGRLDAAEQRAYAADKSREASDGGEGKPMAPGMAGGPPQGGAGPVQPPRPMGPGGLRGGPPVRPVP